MSRPTLDAQEKTGSKPITTTGWTVRGKLGLSFFLVGAAAIAVAVAGFVTISFIAERFHRVSQDTILELAALADLRVGAKEAIGEAHEYALFGRETTLEELEETFAALDQAWQSWEAAGGEIEMAGENSSEREMANRLRAALNGLKAASAQMTAARGSGADPQELENAGEELENAEQVVEAVFEQVQERVDEETEAASSAVTRSITLAYSLLIGLPAATAVLALVAYYLLGRSIVTPIQSLEQTARRIAAGDLGLAAAVTSGDEIGVMARAFNNMTGRLRGLIQQQEQGRLALERRAQYLETIAEVIHEASSMLDLQALLPQVAARVSERFGFYHVGLFLLDPTGEWAVLQAASSEGGRRMLARGHRLRVGQQGVVGYVTGQGERRIALDVGADAVFFENPDLPDTHSEIAFPLRARGKIFGALDVQSAESAAFSEEDAAALQILADQVAMAISNARLFQQAQAGLQEVERVNRLLTREGWETFLRAAPVDFAEFHQPGLAPLAREEGGDQAAEGARPQARPNGRVCVPLEVRGQTIGELIVEGAADQPDWSAADLDLLKALAAQAAQTMDSARLYQDTQRRAARERLINEITARIRSSVTMDGVLNVAAREISQATGASFAAIDLELMETE